MDQKLNIRAADDDLKGRYANFAMLSHNREEFVLDFINNLPPGPLLVSRVILNPAHVKRLLHALEEQVQRYESSFGKLEVANEPPASIGFQA